MELDSMSNMSASLEDAERDSVELYGQMMRTRSSFESSIFESETTSIGKGPCCGTIIVTVLLIYSLLGLIAFGLGISIHNNLTKIDGTIITPFIEIASENKPKSTLSCYYPSLTTNFTNTYYCYGTEIILFHSIFHIKYINL